MRALIMKGRGGHTGDVGLWRRTYVEFMDDMEHKGEIGDDLT